MQNTRTAQILINDKWESINPINLKKGMIFRMFEADGSSVRDFNYIATGDSYYNKNGVITIVITIDCEVKEGIIMSITPTL
jgi:hypothetical protein